MPEDLFHLKMMTHPRLSPSGKEVVSVVHRVDRKNNTYYSNLWITDVETGQTQVFTRGNQKDTQPQWSPDGTRLAFVSNRQKSPQIFVISRHGGEAEAVSSLPDGSISGLTWSPDGSTLAFAFQVEVPLEDGKGYHPDPDMRIPMTAPRVRYLTRFPFKEEGSGFLDDGHPQLWTLALETREARAVAPRPFKQVNPSFSPDGKRLAFYAIRPEDPGFLVQGLDLWLADLETGALTRLADRWGPGITPSWSPDGTKIATIGFRDLEHSAEFHNEYALVVDVETGDVVVASQALDRYAHFYVATDVKAPGTGSSPCSWSADSKKVRFTAMDRGESQLYECDADGRGVTQLTFGNQCVLDFSQVGEHLALLMGAPDYLQDLWMLEPAPGTGRLTPRRLTHINQTFLDGIDLGELKEYCFKAEDGTEIQGWLTLPPGFDPSKKYPLMLQIHGGPHIMAGWMFFQECLLLAAEGYVVAHFNPRGSHGYGEAFASVIFAAWGEVDYRDLMTAVDCLEKEPFIDPTRLGVTGGSYGGYMTNWIVTQTGRFKAAVSHRSTSNLVSAAGSSDMGFENARNAYGAQVWENIPRLMEMSPISYVKNVTTPIMLTQSENDIRCPIEQAEQFYSALKYLGKTVAFCRFPEETHELSRWGRPDRRMERLYRTLEWFRTYL